MTCSIWNDFCQQPTLTVSSDKYTKLVHDSTCQLRQSLEPILSALDRRAIGLSKLAHFESALHDAKVMQQLSPSSPLGYIREATIYSEQGKQRQVIYICNEGLRMADTMDTRYDTLHQIKADAEQRQNIRIDFITQLPSDIVITTIIPLFTDYWCLQPFTPWPYLYVSHPWRERVLQSINGLRFMTDLEETEYEEKDTQITAFARHVKSLNIGQFSQGTWLGDLLRKNDFCSLQELIIDHFTADCVDHLVASLKSISSTLTHLQIVRPSGVMLPIGDVLLNCPNLISLKLFLDSADDLDSLPMMATCTTLATLSIDLAERDLSYNEIMSLAKRLPSLKNLTLCPCNVMEPARGVLDNFPWMKSLEVYNDGPGLEFILSDQGPMCEEIGITDLTIMVTYFEGPIWENIDYILRQCQRTLKRLRFDVDFGSEHEDIYTIEYGRLKKLCLDNSGWWILRHAPMLEELKISTETVSANVAVLDVVPSYLKKLHLEIGGIHDVDQKSLIALYLLRFTSHPHLKELVIDFTNAKSIDNVLYAILHLHQLQHLMVRFNGLWDSNQMQRFLDGLVKGCPHLSSLGINCSNVPSIHSINGLKRLEHLEKLAFSVVNTEGDDNFWYAIQTFSHLKWIETYYAKVVNMRGIRRLRRQRPGLKVTNGNTFISF
ncbi:predicted protein [Lichtheimia corymbifera JMRC:FSU:9682]|uniref:F-box domain-containing protein n=1 Tax=Lichtheimia corymbifera JMRC:FSU:9682 TaxID=1263082 RepID=A0A068S5P3_9FUNG|nr:predicted protein [Lichtheimia corymbifera JMRC:FSU:9682]